MVHGRDRGRRVGSVARDGVGQRSVALSDLHRLFDESYGEYIKDKTAKPD